MFQSSGQRLRAWLTRTEEFLGAEPVDARPHPHRRPLRWDPPRRGGSVAPRYAHCIAPVRPVSADRRRDAAIR